MDSISPIQQGVFTVPVPSDWYSYFFGTSNAVHYWGSGGYAANASTSTTVYTCPSGSQLSGTSCYVYSTPSCTSGGTLSGTTCTLTTSLTCPSGGTLSGTTCRTGCSFPRSFPSINPSIVSGSFIRAADYTSLMSNINYLRADAGLVACSFSAGAPAIGGVIRASHLADLRSCILQVYTACGRTPPSWTDAATVGVTIRALHMQKVVNAVNAAP